MKKILILFFLALSVSFGKAQTYITDEILPELFTPSYKDVAFTGRSGAEYIINALNPQGDKEAGTYDGYFTLRYNKKSGSYSGIVTTKSAGKIRNVTIHWYNDNQSSVEIYRKSTQSSKYKSVGDLYTSSAGSLMETVSYNDTEASSIDISVDYVNFIGILNKDGRISNIEKITVTWEVDAAGTDIVSMPVFSHPADVTYNEPIALSITSATAGATVHYTTDGSEPTITSNIYSEPITIDATTTVKAIAAKEGMTNSSVTSATYKFEVPSVTEKNTYVKVTSMDEIVDGGTYVVFSDNVTVSGQSAPAQYIMGCQDNGQRKALRNYSSPATDGLFQIETGKVSATAVNEITLEENNGQFRLKDPYTNGYLVSKSNTVTDLLTSTTSSLKETLTSIEIDENHNAVVSFPTGRTLGLGSSASTYYFKCYKPGFQSAPIQLYRKVVRFTMSSAGYSTLYSNYPFIVPEHIEAGIIEEQNGNTLTVNYLYQPGDLVPANTALILKGTEGTYNCPVFASSENAPANNLLYGTVDDEGKTCGGTGDRYYYKLSKNNGQLGFWWGAENGAPFVNGQGKAYLVLTKEASESLTNGLSLDFMQDVTAAGELQTSKITPPVGIYDLNGRTVPQGDAKRLPAGIYIINGKTTLIK